MIGYTQLIRTGRLGGRIETNARQSEPDKKDVRMNPGKLNDRVLKNRICAGARCTTCECLDCCGYGKEYIRRGLCE